VGRSDDLDAAATADAGLVAADLTAGPESAEAAEAKESVSVSRWPAIASFHYAAAIPGIAGMLLLGRLDRLNTEERPREMRLRWKSL
jgi:hypothetical protein